jgi:hypothetical protein
MIRYAVMACLALALVTTAVASEPTEPSPELAPERVVAIQLDALQANDDPFPDAGIARAWAFAHLANKRSTGPLARFEIMLKSPTFRALIDHRSHRIERVNAGDDRVAFEVTVVAESGRVLTYGWVVARVEAGDHAESWMTLQVSPPMEKGDAV